MLRAGEWRQQGVSGQPLGRTPIGAASSGGVGCALRHTYKLQNAALTCRPFFSWAVRHISDLLWRAHNHTFIAPTTRDNLLDCRLAAGDVVIAIDASGVAVVVSAINRNGSGRAKARERGA